MPRFEKRRKLVRELSSNILNRETDDEEDEPSIVDENLVKSILKKDELDVIHYDNNFLYCPTITQLPNVFTDMFNFKHSKSSMNKGNSKKTGKLVFKVTGIREKELLYFKPGNVFIPVYKFNRKVSETTSDGKEEIDLMLLVKYYTKRLEACDIVSRIGERGRKEWERIHENRNPGTVYPDRADKQFQEEYKVKEYTAKSNEKEMQREWNKLHKSKKPAYIS